MPRRKRALSRSLRKGTPNQKSQRVQTEQSGTEVLPPSPQNHILSSIASTGAKRRFTNAEYKNELKRMCRENSDLKLELSAHAKKLSAAESKVSQLIESNRISLTKARECKKACTTTEEKVQALEQMLKAHDDDKTLEIQRCLDEAKINAEVSTLFISLCIVINTFDSHYLLCQI